MFCLLEYPAGATPVKNEQLIKQLWGKVNAKYGFHRQPTGSTAAVMSRKDLKLELECRQYHVKHLLETLEQFTNWDQVETAFKVRNEAIGMVTQLEGILTRVKNSTAVNDPLSHNEYQRIITLPKQSEGSYYIDLCERLSVEIIDAELRCMYPITHAQCLEWNCALGTGDEFQPKVGPLMHAIQRDINSLSSNNHHTSLRAKIGFIGYTSAGKTTLVCRLLKVLGSDYSQFLPIRTTKSTYYTLQYDLDRPLVSPDDQQIATAVKFVDIQGCDKGNNISSEKFEAGNYLDEISKADCDIYVIVFSEELDNDQYKWIVFIEQLMQRRCLLVRSKADQIFLPKFLEKWDVCYGMSPAEERDRWSEDTIADLQREFAVEGHRVYLTAATDRPANGDAGLLLQNQQFDLQSLLDELSRLAPTTRHRRVHSLAVRAVARVINSCFRCGYVLNVMKYKIAAGFAAIIPLGDLLPRYLARKDLEQAFGINEEFLQDLQRRQLQTMVELQTSVFKLYVTISATSQNQLRISVTSAGGAIPGVAVISGSLLDDVAQAATRALSVLSTEARVAIVIATVGVGVALSAGICVWSAINTGKHIFSRVNSLCDDLIVVSIPLVESMIEERPIAPPYDSN